MRPGFLLAPEQQQSTAPMARIEEKDPTARIEEGPAVVQAVEAEDCPVCLDALSPEDSVLLPCRHLLCTACTKAVWQVAQVDPARSVNQQLDCPICRTQHSVNHGDLPAFVSAHCAANFGTTPRTPRAAVVRQATGLASLTGAELIIVTKNLKLDMAGMVDRRDIEREVEKAIANNQQPGVPVDSVLQLLPMRCLRDILDMRRIPHDDCHYRVDLAKRIEQSP